MGCIVGMRVVRIIDSLFQHDHMLDFRCDIRVLGTDHDRCMPVSVHVDVRDPVFRRDLDLCCTVSFPVAAVGHKDTDMGKRTVDNQL